MMRLEVLWILVVFTVSGGLSYLLLRRLTPLGTQSLKRLWVFMTVVIFLGFHLAGVIKNDGWLTGVRADDAIIKAFSKLNHPKLQMALNRVQGREERTHLQWELLLKGFHRVSSEDYLRRARLAEKALNKINPTLCAAVFRHRDELLMMKLSLNALDDEELAEWMEIGISGLRNLIEGQAVPSRGNIGVEKVFRGLAQVVPANEFQRVLTGLAARELASDDELCWVARRLHRALGEIPEMYRAALAEILATY